MNKLAAFAASALLLPLAACSSYPAPTAAPATSAPLAATYVFVSNGASTGFIYTYLASSTGTVLTPQASQKNGATNNMFNTLAVDSSGTLYSMSGPSPTTATGNSIEGFSHNGTGALSQTRSITTLTTNTLTGVGTVAVDPTGNIYVGIGTSTQEFAPTSTGDSKPATTLANNSGNMAIDRGGNLYIVKGTQISVFAPGLTSASTPLGTISDGSATSAITSGTPIVVDRSSNIYVLGTSSGSPAILVFPVGSGVGATPSRVITGPATGLNTPKSIAVDGAGTIYLLDVASSGPAQGVVLEFAPSATGNVAPSSSFTSAALTAPQSIAVY